LTLRIAAAADLQFTLPDIVREFEKQTPGVTVEASYGASGNLSAQINQGAPFDLFLSADVQFPEKLMTEGKTADRWFAYARGRLAVWVPKSSAVDFQQQGLAGLTDAAFRKIAIANPAHAPYGRAAVAALRQAGLYDAIADRLVLGENVAQTAQFAQSGAADAAIISLSQAIAPQMAEAGKFWDVPLETYPPLNQGGVVLSHSEQRETARKFQALLLSERGQTILNEHGFLPSKLEEIH